MVKLKHFWLGLIAFCLFLASTVTASSQPISLLNTVKTNHVSQIAMAPNGEHVAYIQSRARDPFTDPDGPAWSELYLITKEGKRKPFVSGNLNVFQVSWSQDSQLLWFLAQKPSDTHLSLYAISINGGEAQRVYQHTTPILGFSLSPDATSLVFWAKPPDDRETLTQIQQGFNAIVFEENTKNNQLWRLSLTEPGQPTLIFEKEHVVKASYFEDGKHLLALISPDALEDNVLTPALVKLDLNGSLISRFQPKGKIDKAIINKKGQVAFIGGIERADPKPGQLFVLENDFTQATLLLTDFEGHIQDITWLGHSKIGFIAHQGTEAFWAEKKVAQVGPTFRKRRQSKEILESVSVDESSKALAFISHSPEHPNEAFWLTNNQFIRISNSNPQLSNASLPKQEVLSFTAEDGTKLEGIYVWPLNHHGDTPPPLILFIHGGPEAHYSNGWLNRYSHPAYYAASLGYASFFPNYRGSTARGVTFSQLGQGDLAGKEFTDIIDAKQFLVKKGLADASRVGITGASYGGYASAWAATAQSEHFAASVMFAGISNQVSKFGTTDIPNELYQTHARKWPWEDWNYLLKRSPIYYLDKHQTPLLILHGQLDERVHAGQALELYRHLKVRDQAPVRLVLYPNEGHGNSHAAAKLDYATRLMRWMTHFLLDKKTTLPPNHPPERAK